MQHEQYCSQADYGVKLCCSHPQVDREEAEMKTDKPAPISFKKLKTTKSDTSGVGKVDNCPSSFMKSFSMCCYRHQAGTTTAVKGCSYQNSDRVCNHH